MKAAVLYEPNTPLVIEEISVRKPLAREVLIRTAVSGLCHSDLHFIEGLFPHPLPVVLGHEAAGLFCKNAVLRKKLLDAAEDTGQQLWHLPMWDEY